MKKVVFGIILISFLASLTSCSTKKRRCKSAWEAMKKGSNCVYVY